MDEIAQFRSFIDHSIEAGAVADEMIEEPCVIEMARELDQTQAFLFVYLDSVRGQFMKDIAAIINAVDAGDHVDDAIKNAPEFTFGRRGMSKAWDQLCHITGDEYERRGGEWAEDDGFPLTAIGQAIANLARGTSQ